MEDHPSNDFDQMDHNVLDFYQAYQHMLELLEAGSITPGELNMWIANYDQQTEVYA